MVISIGGGEEQQQKKTTLWKTKRKQKCENIASK